MTTVCILLAAGHSRRFGPDNKLLADLKDRPLISYAATTSRAMPCQTHFAVISDPALGPLLDGFELLTPEGDAADQAASLRAGIRAAAHLGATRALLMLGDMPFVTQDLALRVLGATTKTSASAATDGQRPMPPACFPSALFPQMLTLTGDQGARALLRSIAPAFLVPAPARALLDIDTVEQLTQASKP